MTKEEILHLGELARIRLTDDEVQKLQGDITNILEYVGVVNDVVTDAALEKKVGVVHNVFREDEITNEPGAYTQVLLAEMPETKGKFLKVKKILNPDA